MNKDNIDLHKKLIYKRIIYSRLEDVNASELIEETGGRVVF